MSGYVQSRSKTGSYDESLHIKVSLHLHWSGLHVYVGVLGITEKGVDRPLLRVLDANCYWLFFWRLIFEFLCTGTETGTGSSWSC